MFKMPQLFGTRAVAPETPLDPAVQALSESAPCGPWLEEDPEYAVFQGKLRPRDEIQYGNFVKSATGPDWREIELHARTLLARSRDINLLVAFTNARFAQAGATGLVEGLQWLLSLMQAWPEDLHPQLLIDGEFDPALRANALAGLVDPQGLLGQLRQLQIQGGTGTRLLVRDVERALARVRAADAMPPEAVRAQLRELRRQGDATLSALFEALALMQGIDDCAHQQLEDHAPDLSPLQQVLAALDLGEPAPQPAPMTAVVQPHTTEPIQFEDYAGVSLTEEREQVLQSLRQARQWVERHEPSSPVSVLLKQAERMWGRRFSEVAHVIPAELLRDWDRD